MRGPVSSQHHASEMVRTGFHWRLMTSLDLPDIGGIAEVVHPGFPEDLPILAEKQRLYPDGAWLLEIAGRASGYLLSHPWGRHAIPPLNRLLLALPARTTSYYLHDLALVPAARGSGAAPTMVANIAEHARRAGYAELALCAVNRSRGFWEKQGFVVRRIPGLRAKLDAYEPAARYMTLAL